MLAPPALLAPAPDALVLAETRATALLARAPLAACGQRLRAFFLRGAPPSRRESRGIPAPPPLAAATRRIIRRRGRGGARSSASVLSASPLVGSFGRKRFAFRPTAKRTLTTLVTERPFLAFERREVQQAQQAERDIRGGRGARPGCSAGVPARRRERWISLTSADAASLRRPTPSQTPRRSPQVPHCCGRRVMRQLLRLRPGLGRASVACHTFAYAPGARELACRAARCCPFWASHPRGRTCATRLNAVRFFCAHVARRALHTRDAKRTSHVPHFRKQGANKPSGLERRLISNETAAGGHRRCFPRNRKRWTRGPPPPPKQRGRCFSPRAAAGLFEARCALTLPFLPIALSGSLFLAGRARSKKPSNKCGGRALDRRWSAD